MVSFLNGKKGQLIQVTYVLVLLFIVGISILFTSYLLSQFNAGIREANLNSSEVERAMVNTEAGFKMADYAYLLMFILLTILLIWTTYLVPTHPIFAVVNIIGIFFLVFIGMVLTNLYGEMTVGQNAELTVEANDYNLVNQIISYLPYIAAGLIFITTIIQYARGSNAGY